MSNESSSFSSLSCIPVLTGSTDYARWSLAIKNVAMMADVWEYPDSTETYLAPVDIKAPTTDETTAIKVWKKANSKALGLMGSTCTEELQIHINKYHITTTSKDPPTTHKVWLLLGSVPLAQ